jgi:hypothetical protein
VKNSSVGQKVKIKIESVGPRFATAISVGNPSETKKESEPSESNIAFAESV